VVLSRTIRLLNRTEQQERRIAYIIVARSQTQDLVFLTDFEGHFLVASARLPMISAVLVGKSFSVRFLKPTEQLSECAL